MKTVKSREVNNQETNNIFLLLIQEKYEDFVHTAFRDLNQACRLSVEKTDEVKVGVEAHFRSQFNLQLNEINVSNNLPKAYGMLSQLVQVLSTECSDKSEFEARHELSSDEQLSDEKARSKIICIILLHSYLQMLMNFIRQMEKTEEKLEENKFEVKAGKVSAAIETVAEKLMSETFYSNLDAEISAKISKKNTPLKILKFLETEVDESLSVNSKIFVKRDKNNSANNLSKAVPKRIVVVPKKAVSKSDDSTALQGSIRFGVNQEVADPKVAEEDAVPLFLASLLVSSWDALVEFSCFIAALFNDAEAEKKQWKSHSQSKSQPIHVSVVDGGFFKRQGNQEKNISGDRPISHILTSSRG